ncbi:MAG: PocR ligand-binding domain-containing protein [Anaerolineales bacterium]|jgi:excisionase family DNA binding protein
MTELLTSKQVQDLLQVDRTTVYRMLKDGRLTGVKVGRQWRFRRREIDDLISASHGTEAEVSSPSEVLPLGCIQSIQNVFAQIAEVGAITTDFEGKPVTEISNCSPFCQLILNSPSGYKGCIESWRRLAEIPNDAPVFSVCHAGLQYARGYIEVHGEPIAMNVAGQFYVQAPDPEEEEARIRELAEKYDIDVQDLMEAARDISVLDNRKQAKIGLWMQEVARTFSDIGNHRADILIRLSEISELSNLELEI